MHKVALSFLVSFAFGTYSHTLVTSELTRAETDGFVCTTAAQWVHFVDFFSLLNILLDIIIPFLIIFIFNCLFSCKFLKKLRLDQNKNSCLACCDPLKSKEDSVFTKKHIFRHKLLERKPPVANISHACTTRNFRTNAVPVIQFCLCRSNKFTLRIKLT
jgi:hypothetical protein